MTRRKDDIRPRLLVIDDDQQVGVTIARVARRGGFEPSVTTTFEAFRAAYDDAVEVVVIDLAMPETDGIEVIRFLASRSCRAGVILASGVDRPVLTSAVQLAADRGLRVLGSVGKPFAVRDLLDLLPPVGPLEPRAAVSAPEPPHIDELRAAIESDELYVAFQPKVDLRSDRLVGVEALVRWQHERGPIPAEALVALAEEHGLMEELTLSVMTKAFASCASWRRDGLNVGVAVNVSSKSISDIDLPDRISLIAADAGLEASNVVLELTESCLPDDLVTAADVLTRVRLKGFELSIDDFGTGYSTLQQLKRLPFSELKLDRSFVVPAPQDREARAIVESSIELAHALDLRVVAEGIERPEQRQLMADLGADHAQGNLIGKPMVEADFRGWAQRWNS